MMKSIIYINNGWDLYRPNIYNESLEDNNPYEGKLYDSTAPVFPYDLKDMYAKNDAGYYVQLHLVIIY
jgi:hypothetical protein